MADQALLVGNMNQHKAVEAGRLFALWQEAKMRNVQLGPIVRQRDPELKRAVKHFAGGEAS